jgi:hypothetical protein
VTAAVEGGAFRSTPAAGLSKRIHMRLPTLLVLALLAVGPPAHPAPTYTADYNKDGRPDQWYEVTGERVSKVSMDRDFDGKVDYVAEFDAEGRKVREEMDYNHDGSMDIWVFLDGVYIHRYEVDADFDGQVDRVRDYSAQ